MKRLVSLAFLAGLWLALWALPDVADRLTRKPDEVWARLHASGVMHFATEATFHPFEGVGSDGIFYGLDIDVAREIARRLGAQAGFRNVGIDGLYDVLRVGQADASISAMPIDPGRLEKWAYSRPYFDDGLVLVTSSDSGLHDAGDLPGHTIAVELGSDGDTRLRYYQRRAAGIAAAQLDSASDALAAVEDGRADAAIVDTLAARHLIATRFDGLRIAARLTSEPYVIAVWGESVDLLAAINGALDEMERDGTLERIIAEWMGK